VPADRPDCRGGKTGKIVNQEGQFLAPGDEECGGQARRGVNLILTERGASFGCNNLWWWSFVDTDHAETVVRWFWM
jgi:3-deoxy-D-manno-octulosonic acid (KDO) 8-phosphate synthase